MIYGDGPLASPLMDAIVQRPELGLRVSGYVGSCALHGACRDRNSAGFRRPVILRQKHVGEYGVPFTVYKFRTMYDGGIVPTTRFKKHTNSDQSHIGTPAHDGDQGITRVGKWLRRSRLDKLPQLFNIVKGDISCVGPRPVPLHEEEECAAVIPFYKERWLIKPGATGWAQINRGYNATIEDHKEKLAYDLFYIKNVSIGLDIYILFATLKILLLGRGGR